MSDPPRKQTPSERARAEALEEKRLQQDAEEQARIDQAVKSYALELAAEDEDTGIKNLRDVAREAGVKFPDETPVTSRPAPVTKPTPEALRESRHEPTPVPVTIPSPPPKMTPPAGFPMPPYPPDSGTKILVVDRNPAVLGALTDTLGEEGYRVWRASDGWEAVEQLVEMPRVDLILLELDLPRVNGLEFLLWLNKPHNPWRDTEVLVISDASSAELDPHFFYVKKPIDYAQLIDTIRTRIKARRGT